MATPNRKVLDISHWNTVTDWSAVKAAGIIGIIAKATEGNYYTDDQYTKTRDACAQHGLLFGAYHFATGNNVTEQVSRFLNKTGIHDDMLYALDWEDYDNEMSYSQATEFLQQCDAALGDNRTVVYAGNTAKEKIPGNDPFMGAHRLWLAQYGSNPTCQQSWSTYWLWQYSDGQNGPGPHGCPGVSGDVDTNSWPSTDAALIAEWSGSEQEPAPGPDPDPGPNPIPPTFGSNTVRLNVMLGTTVFVNNTLVYPVVPTKRLSRRGERQ